ncbi:hypothetical protein CEUSTIGMA_g11119.t1 [Chlamydomonas eustigma]|uniref:Helicase C-terminal domain-containing protein n=1 Tax=Chlamydomonas eustigma TaxID=1157962 RepID=A0A250XKU0_9CHLO|nr:hypothetical protein CEUSTIGMA_g11119.t1 [Chlamydomonas eustigma]|eukprot:GAX83694.1 hypothetical protein CEUSTIGMA_g11119.t1 [Chlamydomonas eustigma]
MSLFGQLRRFYVAVSQQESKLETLQELITALSRDCGTSADYAAGREDRSGAEAEAAGQMIIAICCSSRDSLDAVAAVLLDADHDFSISVLHSSMTEREREYQLQRVRRRTGGVTEQLAGCHFEVPAPLRASNGMPAVANAEKYHPNLPNSSPRTSLGMPPLKTVHSSHSSPSPTALLLVTTDPPLRAAPKDFLPLGASLLIQYDLAPQKEVYLKRVAAAFGGGKERRNTKRSTVVDFVAGGEVGAFRESESWFSGTIHEMPVHVADIFK